MAEAAPLSARQMKKPPSGRLFYLAGGEHRAREALPGFDGSAGAEPDRRRRVPGRSAHRDRVHGCTRQSPSLRQITEKGCLRAAFFSYLAGDAKCAARASPQTLLRNVRAPPLAGLSPPLSGQPLNRGACCSRSINGFPSCGDAWSTVPLPRSMAVQRQDLPHVVAPRASCPRPDHWPCRGDATTRWHSLPVAMLGPQGIDARYRAG